MKILSPYLLSLLLISACTGQKSSSSDLEEYSKQTNVFLQDVYGKELLRKDLILVNQPGIDCLNEAISNSFFTAEETEQIKHEVENPKIKDWQKVIRKPIKYINQDTINKIFDSKYKENTGWNYYYKNIGRSFNSISAPIFFRNYSYCLFYESNSCGWLCGTGNLVLYKKVKDKWIQDRSFCNWIS